MTDDFIAYMAGRQIRRHRARVEARHRFYARTVPAAGWLRSFRMLHDLRTETHR